MNDRQALRRDAVLAAACLVTLFFAWKSLAWPLVHDLPILLYEGFLTFDRGLVPYRDFFDMNPPGTLLVYGWLHRATGGAALALRGADLLGMLGIGAATAVALARHGWRSGLLAAATFAVLCFSAGPTNALQREFLALLPLTLALALVFRAGRRPWALALAGFCAGVVFTIKPPLVLCWLPLWLHAALAEKAPEQKPGGALLRSALLLGGGALVPVVAVALWLAARGGLAAYLDIASHYYPLYTQLDGLGNLRPSGFAGFYQRWLSEMVPILLHPYAVAGAAGLLLSARLPDRHLAAQSRTLAGVAAAAALYLPISGKFWVYHQMPLYFALAAGAGLLLSGALPEASNKNKMLLLLAASWPFLAALCQLEDFAQEEDLAQSRARQSERIAAYLEKYPEAKVLPLDTAEGAIRASYTRRQPLYGRFIYDFHFYHHPENPYIQKLRQQLLDELQNEAPEIVIECQGWGKKATTTAAFPELETKLQSYETVLEEQDCQVRRRQ